MLSDFEGSLTRFLLSAGSITLASWLNLGMSSWIIVCGLMGYHIYRQYVLDCRHRIIHSHRALMNKEGFKALFDALPSEFSPPSWISYPEEERSRTLNHILSALWPQVKVATEEVVLTSMVGVLAPIRDDLKLSVLKLDVFELTNETPTITTVDTVMVDGCPAIDLNLNLNGKSNIIIVAGKGKVKVAVTLKDFVLNATLRVYLAPASEEIPGFKALCISMVHRPHIDYTLKALKLPLSSIAGLEGLIDSIVQESVASALLWPKKIVIPLDAEPNHMLISHLSSTPAVGILRVEFVSAKELNKMDTFGSADPYIKAFIRGDDKVKTTVKKNTRNPVWNEVFEFEIFDPKADVLNMKLKDQDIGGNNDTMALCEINVDSLTPEYEETIGDKPLFVGKKKSKAGFMTLKLTYKPFINASADFPSGFEHNWSAGILYVDLQSAFNIETKKSIKLNVSFGDKTLTTPDTYPNLKEANFGAVMSKGMRFFINEYKQPFGRVIKLAFSRNLGEETVEFDLDNLHHSENGEFHEVIFAESGVVLQFHLTLKSVKDRNMTAEEKKFSSISQSSTTSIKSTPMNKSPEKPSIAADLANSSAAVQTFEEKDIDDVDDFEGEEEEISTLHDMDATTSSKAVTEKKLDQKQGTVAIVKGTLATASQTFSILNRDTQSTIVSSASLLGIASLSRFWNLSVVGWALLLSFYFYGIYDIARRYRTKDKKPIVKDSEEDRATKVNTQPDDLDIVVKYPKLAGNLFLNLPPFCTSPSWEKQEWINDLLSALWKNIQGGVDAMIEEMVNAQIKEALENGVNKFVDDVTFDITFGKPPLIVAMFVPPKSHSSNQVIVDMKLELGDDVHVVAVAKKGKFSIPVEVRDFHFSSRFRVVLRDFVPVFPCFATMDICFIEAPELDFNLNIAHVPIMSFPFLTEAVNYALQTFVFMKEDMPLIWPHYLRIPIIDPSDPAIQHTTSTPPAGIFRVTILRAHNLRNVDRFSVSDPYVTIIYHEGDGIKKRTKTIDNNLNPVWNETFDFVLLNTASRYITMTCKDDEKVGQHEVLGRAEAVTDDLLERPDTPIQRTFEFTHKDKSAGSMDVEFEFKPFTDTISKEFLDLDVEDNAIAVLFVDVAGCKGLKKAHSPFVSISVDQETRITDTREGDSPVFHDSFQFLVKDIVSSSITITVFDEISKFGRKTRKRIGTHTVNFKDVADVGVLQGPFGLEGGAVVEATLTLRAVSPENHDTLHWNEYLKILDDARKEKREEVKHEMEEKRQAEAEIPPLDHNDSVIEAADLPGNTKPVGDDHQFCPTSPGFVILRVIKGQNLPAVDRSGFSDPYVSMTCEGKKKRTKYIKRNINPRWDEKLDFYVRNPQSSVIVFNVKDHESLGRNRGLGTFSVNVSSLSTQEEVTKDFPLEALGKSTVAPRGYVTVAFSYQEDVKPREVHTPVHDYVDDDDLESVMASEERFHDRDFSDTIHTAHSSMSIVDDDDDEEEDGMYESLV
eukprot:m.124445 g.124445  ORF g.124445 m.124445 type:complete len:1487 (-) comp9425_c3_seq2:1858-6318(-)